MWIKWISLLGMLLLIASSINSLQATENKQIKVIVFDFGSVIAKTDTQQVVNFIAQSLHISESEALATLKQLKEYSLQGKKEQEFWKFYADSRGIQLPENWQEKFYDVRIRAIKEIPGMLDLVKDLQRQGYQTALLSNIRKNQAEIKRKLGYYNLFNPVLLSYDIGVRKPDRQAYEILLNRLKMPPQAVLFIDNRQENVEAAKALGIDGIVFINREQLIQELKKRGIEITSGKTTNPQKTHQ